MPELLSTLKFSAGEKNKSLEYQEKLFPLVGVSSPKFGGTTENCTQDRPRKPTGTLTMAISLSNGGTLEKFEPSSDYGLITKTESVGIVPRQINAKEFTTLKT